MASVQEHLDIWSVCDEFGKLCIDPSDGPVRVDDFVVGYENPIAWHRDCRVSKEKLTKDVLFDNMDMKDITMAQYDHEKPEYIKWKLFGYNIVICYEFISKGKMDQALQTIVDIEDILESIGSYDTFLKSIRMALDHITYSMKGYVLKLCSITTMKLKSFIMPYKMNNVNKAGLFGIKSLFFYEYGLPCAHLSKESALEAISLNETEAEWRYLMARVLTHWQRSCGNYYECSQKEIYECEMAVKLGDKDHHKLHLVQIYYRMSRNIKRNEETVEQIRKESCKLLNDVMNSTTDVLLLKSCLISISKIALQKDNKVFSDILEKLVEKLSSSDNGYVHGAIGNYYLFNKKDYKRANFHLKKAADVKSFGCSIDYIYTFYKINSETAPVEHMLVGLLKTFTHPVYQEKILSQILSYLILTRNDLIRALKYIPKLFTFRYSTCVYSMQTHKIKFSPRYSSVNLLEVLTEKLDEASNNQTLSADDMKKVKELVSKLEAYKTYVSTLMKDKNNIFGNDFKKNSQVKNVEPLTNNDRRVRHFSNGSYKQDITHVKDKDESNWRTLKPDDKPSANVFSRGHQKTSYDFNMNSNSHCFSRNKF